MYGHPGGKFSFLLQWVGTYLGFLKMSKGLFLGYLVARVFETRVAVLRICLVLMRFILSRKLGHIILRSIMPRM